MNAKLCTICQIRPVPSRKTRTDAGMSADMLYCLPCFEEAGWENSHSDGHADDAEAADCWFCHPELNEAQREYAPRVGTSRAGMQITVPIRGTGAEKAAAVKARLDAAAVASKTSTKKGITMLRVPATADRAEVRIVWDAQGRFDYAASSVGDKKVRNVAAALAALGA